MPRPRRCSWSPRAPRRSGPTGTAPKVWSGWPTAVRDRSPVRARPSQRSCGGSFIFGGATGSARFRSPAGSACRPRPSTRSWCGAGSTGSPTSTGTPADVANSSVDPVRRRNALGCAVARFADRVVSEPITFDLRSGVSRSACRLHSVERLLPYKQELAASIPVMRPLQPGRTAVTLAGRRPRRLRRSPSV